MCFVIKLPACGQKTGMKTFLWRKNKWIAWNERQKWEIDEITSRVKWRYLHVWTLERNKFSHSEMLLDCCLPQFNYISFFWCNFIAIWKFYGILEFLIDVNIKLADRTMLKASQILALFIYYVIVYDWVSITSSYFANASVLHTGYEYMKNLHWKYKHW